MSILRKMLKKRFVVYCMLQVTLFPMVSPQVAFAAAESDVKMTVEQIVSKPAGSTAADTFTYTMTASQSDYPMPADSIEGTYAFTISGTDIADIGPITYSTAGVYRYEIKQSVDSMKTGYTCDMQVYTVWVYAKYSSGRLKTEVVVIKENGFKASAILFENTYIPLASDSSIMINPPVRKTVFGIPNEEGTFTFKLEAEKKSNPMPYDSSEGVKLMTIMGPGEGDFDTWSYTEAGTYTYTVSEVPNGETGYIYDTSVYTIMDNVTDVDGQLEVTRTVEDSSQQPVDSFKFVNKYTSGGSGTANSTKGAKTSDDVTPELYQTMLFVSGAMFIAFLRYMIIAVKKR